MARTVQGFFLRRLAYGASSVAGLVMYVALRGSSWAAELATAVAYTVLLLGLAMADENTRPHLSAKFRGSALANSVFIHIVFLALVVATERLAALPLADAPSWMLVSPGHKTPLLWLLVSIVFFGSCYLEKFVIFHGPRKRSIESLMSAQPRALVTATAADHDMWLAETFARNMGSFKRGSVPSDDFEKWLRARGKTQRTTYHSSWGVGAVGSASGASPEETMHVPQIRG